MNESQLLKCSLPPATWLSLRNTTFDLLKHRNKYLPPLGYPRILLNVEPLFLKLGACGKTLFKHTFVEPKTRTPHKLDLGSPDDHTTLPSDTQTAEDNHPGRLCGGTNVQNHKETGLDTMVSGWSAVWSARNWPPCCCRGRNGRSPPGVPKNGEHPKNRYALLEKGLQGQ